MAHVFRTEWSEWNEFRCHDVSVRWIQHDLTSAVYPTLNLTNPMVTTPRNRIHQFMFVLSCISRGWRTIIHFNYYSTMLFCKTATKCILHPMVTWWFGFVVWNSRDAPKMMVASWCWWFEASSLRVSTLPCQGAREEGLCRAMCPNNIQKYHPGLWYKGLSSFCWQVVDLKMMDFPFYHVDFPHEDGLIFSMRRAMFFLQFVMFCSELMQLRSPKGGTSRWVKRIQMGCCGWP